MPIFIGTNNKGKLREFSQYFHCSGGVIGVHDLEMRSGEKYREPNENSDYFLSNACAKLFSTLQFLVHSCDRNKEILFDVDQVIVDDSGLCVPALGFVPGVHSAFYAGQPKDDEKNNLKLIKEIENHKDSEDFQDQKRLSAFFICFLFSMKIKNISELRLIKNLNLSEAKIFENEHVIKLEQHLLHKIDFTVPSGGFLDTVQAELFSHEFPKGLEIQIASGFCTGEVSNKMQKTVSHSYGYDPLFYLKNFPNLSFANMSLEEKNKYSHRAQAMRALQYTP